jgi:hypothetical protein
MRSIVRAIGKVLRLLASAAERRHLEACRPLGIPWTPQIPRIHAPGIPPTRLPSSLLNQFCNRDRDSLNRFRTAFSPISGRARASVSPAARR